MKAFLSRLFFRYPAQTGLTQFVSGSETCIGTSLNVNIEDSAEHWERTA